MSVVEATPYKEKVVFFDADNTLHPGFSIVPVYQALSEAGLAEPADVTQMVEVHTAYHAGELEYELFAQRALDIAARAVRGREQTATFAIAEKFFKQADFPWFGYVQPTIKALHDRGNTTVLVTAEPQFIAHGIIQRLELTAAHHTVFGLEPRTGRYSGEIHGVLGSSAKGEAIQTLKAFAQTTAAFGDSEGDIGMLELVNRPVCIQPTPGLLEQAETAGWEVITDPDRPIDLLVSDPKPSLYTV